MQDRGSISPVYSGGEFMTLYTNPKLIGLFLAICHSNWHRCCYVKCKGCKLQDSCKHPDFLFIPDSHAQPVPMLKHDITVLFSMSPESEECHLQMTFSQFCEWYETYLHIQKIPKDTCPVLYLQKQLEKTLDDW